MSIPEQFISDIAHLLGKDPSEGIVAALAEKAIDGAGKKKDQRIPEFLDFIENHVPPGELDGTNILELMICLTHLYRAKYR